MSIPKAEAGKKNQAKFIISSKWWRNWTNFVNFYSNQNSNDIENENITYPRPSIINNELNL